MSTFVQYGAGNIGRGFLGQVFGDAGYEIKFIDINPDIINMMNNENKYPINIISRHNPREVWINNASCVNGLDEQAVALAISKADIMAVSVGVNILPRIVKNLVKGFRMRWTQNNLKPLDIIIAENLIDADSMLRGLITDILSDDEQILFEKTIGLVESSVGRMVPVMTSEMSRGNILRVCVENYCELPVDKAAFKGKIPSIPHLHPFEPFEFYVKRKLYIHNMGHALAAYLGFVYGYDYVWQAIENPYIKLIVQRAMTESGTALSKQFSMPLSGILEHISDLLLRFANRELGDTVSRVGRDVLRKLRSSDRFGGAINMCHGQSVNSLYIPVGIAAALMFASANDTNTKDDIDTVLVNTCGLEKGSSDFNIIKDYYALLTQNIKPDELLRKIESRQEILLSQKVII